MFRVGQVKTKKPRRSRGVEKCMERCTVAIAKRCVGDVIHFGGRNVRWEGGEVLGSTHGIKSIFDDVCLIGAHTYLILLV